MFFSVDSIWLAALDSASVGKLLNSAENLKSKGIEPLENKLSC